MHSKIRLIVLEIGDLSILIPCHLFRLTLEKEICHPQGIIPISLANNYCSSSTKYKKRTGDFLTWKVNYLESQLLLWRSFRKFPVLLLSCDLKAHHWYLHSWNVDIWRQWPLLSLLVFPSLLEILEFQSLIAISYFDSFILVLGRILFRR